MLNSENHTFVIVAYKENPYLEKTIQSVLSQTVQSKVLLSTSTPNTYIENLCERYRLSYVVNPQGKGAGNDWNYGYNQATTDLVTIVHQDDIYEPDYLEKVLNSIRKADDLLIAFTDYYELRDEKKISDTKILKIKRVMNFFFKIKCFQKWIWLRKRILAFGDSISCPTVTLNKAKLGESIFDERMKNSCDYITWVQIAKMKGSFVYVPNLLVGHRIYPESATTLNIADSSRTREDLEIMMSLWPKFIAKMIHKRYIQAEKSNELN